MPSQIKLFITDIDGVMTDGGYYHFFGADDGSGFDHVDVNMNGLLKKFNTRDFHGLQMLHDSGVKVVAITTSNSRVNSGAFQASAPYATLIQGAKNKHLTLIRHFESNKETLGWDSIVHWNHVAYIGDDVFDWELLNYVGVAACPSDAEDSIIEYIKKRPDGYVMNAAGGNKCVREFANLILKINQTAV